MLGNSGVIAAIKARYNLLAGRVDERLLRQLAGAEAKVLGRGGVSAVGRATGLAINTIRRGVAELSDDALSLPEGRVRKAGGGRKKLCEKDPGLVAELEKLVEPFSRDDPMRPLRWTCKSVRRMAAELVAKGHRISAAKVAELLAEVGYSLQSHRKRDEGNSHEDRDAQFQHINDEVEAFQGEEQPVISVDTKKKELVGAYKNSGREWRLKGQPEEVKVYDFIDQELGKAIPYGIYDLQRNEGWVSVGCDHDTSELAVESIRRWWRKLGSERYPKAKRLLITADGGGSNSARGHLWKWCLAQLSCEVGLAISVCHFPPATSKWNKIEHRLFCHITQNWRGKALVNHEVVVELITATTTRAGLKVNAERDESIYKTEKKPDAAQMAAALNLTRAKFHGEWNYTLHPEKSRT